MNKQSKYLLVALSLVGTLIIPAQVLAASGGQAIYEDDGQMVSDEGSRIEEYQQSAQDFEHWVMNHDAQAEPYRQYATHTVQQLIKRHEEKGAKALTPAEEEQMNALQEWLNQDAQTRAQEQARIKQLNHAIANMQKQRNATFGNLGSDINTMREDQETKAEDTRFNQMMAVNQFNELQSEMGACTWGRPPVDGTFNSVGGYGMNGGYGYSFGGGRRW